jgi:hypothetical protein
MVWFEIRSYRRRSSVESFERKGRGGRNSECALRSLYVTPWGLSWSSRKKINPFPPDHKPWGLLISEKDKEIINIMTEAWKWGSAHTFGPDTISHQESRNPTGSVSLRLLLVIHDEMPLHRSPQNKYLQLNVQVKINGWSSKLKTFRIYEKYYNLWLRISQLATFLINSTTNTTRHGLGLGH